MVAAAQAGDEGAFTELVQRYRRELQVHCYRMIGSVVESEDLVQETFLKAWTKRESFQGRSTFRAWLYRIATNTCLDHLARRPRRVLAYEIVAAADPKADAPPEPTTSSYAWLEPYPDHLLERIESADDPYAVVVAKETIELAFLAAIQHLPPKQRAVMIMRDVLDWSANETADVLELSVPAVKSALQRARATLREELPPRRTEWASTDPSAEERAVLERLTAADPADLALRFGPTIGPHLRQLGRGGDRWPVVDEPWVARSRSRETTFEQDLTVRSAMEAQVARLAAELTREVVGDGRLVVRVAVKVRYASFFTRTKISKLPAPATDPEVVERAALVVLDRFDLTRPVRLLGVRVELDPPAAR